MGACTTATRRSRRSADAEKREESTASDREGAGVSRGADGGRSYRLTSPAPSPWRETAGAPTPDHGAFDTGGGVGGEGRDGPAGPLPRRQVVSSPLRFSLYLVNREVDEIFG